MKFAVIASVFETGRRPGASELVKVSTSSWRTRRRRGEEQVDSNSRGGPQGPELGDLLSMGLTIALCVMAGFGLGWLVDLPFGTFPVFALVGLLLGVIAAGGFVYRMFKRFQ